MTSFLRKIGFANSDGSPTNIYRKFCNKATAGEAAAEALRIGYAPLYKRNEYLHELEDDELRGLIIEETGQGTDSGTLPLILSSIKALKRFATWHGDGGAEATSGELVEVDGSEPSGAPEPSEGVGALGMNLSYTINLNLPATSDIAVFNAIFKSLKENLLKG